MSGHIPRVILALAVAAGATVSVRATSAAGPIIAPEGTQAGGLVNGTPPAHVVDKCSACHGGGSDEDGKAFRPWDSWSGTMMAQAMRDPLFLAALTVSEQDVPGSGAYCIRCHTPKGFVKGHATGLGAALDDDDMQGVDCEGCHRAINGGVMQPMITHEQMEIAALPVVDLMAPYIGNARLIWDPRDVRHGPRSDADSPAHSASGSAFGSSSELCGQCHELQSPSRNLLDASGKDTGIPFPLDTTYTEWRSSDFANGPTAERQSCIDCHMPRARGDALTLATHPAAMPRANPRMHLFAGGNEWGLDAVQKAEPALALERAAGFAAAKEAVKAMLAKAVQVNILPPSAAAGSTSFDVTVRVTNLGGHKFPSGYADGRRAFLQVELLDATGRSLAIRGKYDEATQHLDDASTPRIWKAIHAERTASGGHIEWHIVKSDIVVKDTRIPPKGFRPMGATAVAITAPLGVDYGPPSGMRNYDDVPVRFTGLQPLPAGKLTVVARVFYQSTMREFVEELERANKTDDRGTKLRAIWEQTGKAAPRLIQSQTLDLTVANSNMDAGPGDGGGMGADVLIGDGGIGDAQDAPTPVPPTADPGCACSTIGGTAGSGPAWLSAFLLLAAGVHRRRRR